MKNKPLFLSLIIFLIIIIGLFCHNSDMILSSLFMIFYLLFDLLLKPEKRQIKLKALRNCESILENNKSIIKVHLKVGNSGKSTIYIIIDNDYENRKQIIQGSSCHQSLIKPGKDAILSYSLKCQRGVYQWDKLKVSISGPLECFKSTLMIDAFARLVIQPHFKKIRPIKWHPWKPLSSQGVFETNTSGNSTDFYGVREYRPGDSMKTLYWKLTAKHRNKFFTKEFVQEQNASITLVLDGRKNMNTPVNGKNLLEYEIKLAAALSEMFISQGNQVGLSIIGQKNGTLRSGYGKRQLYRILNCLAQTGIDDNNELYANLASLNRRQYSGKTQFVFISPLHYDDISYYRDLRFLGYQITLICPEVLYTLYPPDQTANNNPLRMCKIERKLFLDLIARMSITVINWQLDKPIESLLKNAQNKPISIRKI